MINFASQVAEILFQISDELCCGSETLRVPNIFPVSGRFASSIAIFVYPKYFTSDKYRYRVFETFLSRIIAVTIQFSLSPTSLSAPPHCTPQNICRHNALILAMHSPRQIIFHPKACSDNIFQCHKAKKDAPRLANVRYYLARCSQISFPNNTKL